MENQGESQQVLCCGAKTWSLVIGWLQTIFSALGIAFLVLTYFVVGEVLKEGINDRTNSMTPAEKETQESTLRIAHVFILVIFIIAIITWIIQLVGGIFLIQGVNQRNVRKIKIWTVIQIVFLVFTVFHGILTVLRGGFSQVVQDVIGILITIFCLWVVNIHKQELLLGGAGRAPVSYGVSKA